MADWECVLPFGIDDGELDGLTPQECFTLGVEWQMVREQAEENPGFSTHIHTSNRERIAALLDRHSRLYTITFLHDDVSEGWLWLSVDPRSPIIE